MDAFIKTLITENFDRTEALEKKLSGCDPDYDPEEQEDTIRDLVDQIERLNELIDEQSEELFQLQQENKLLKQKLQKFENQLIKS